MNKLNPLIILILCFACGTVPKPSSNIKNKVPIRKEVRIEDEKIIEAGPANNNLYENSFKEMTENVEVFAIHKVKDGDIFIDSNELGFRGESRSSNNKYRELIMINKEGSSSVSKFVETIDDKIETCDKPVPRRLWKYRVPTGESTDVFLAFSAKSVKNIGLQLTEEKRKPLSPERQKHIQQVAKELGRDSLSCINTVYGKIEEIHCEGVYAAILINGKLVASSIEDYSAADVSLVTILEINGVKYYVYTSTHKDGSHYGVVSEEGKQIYVIEGDFPTMC